jgi:hypothetical protein
MINLSLFLFIFHGLCICLHLCWGRYTNSTGVIGVKDLSRCTLDGRI